MVVGHPFDVCKSLLGCCDQLRSTLLQPSLVLILLVEPVCKKFSLRFGHEDPINRCCSKEVDLRMHPKKRTKVSGCNCKDQRDKVEVFQNVYILGEGNMSDFRNQANESGIKEMNHPAEAKPSSPNYSAPQFVKILQLP